MTSAMKCCVYGSIGSGREYGMYSLPSYVPRSFHCPGISHVKSRPCLILTPLLLTGMREDTGGYRRTIWVQSQMNLPWYCYRLGFMRRLRYEMEVSRNQLAQELELAGGSEQDVGSTLFD